MRLHVFGLPFSELTTDWSHCAFTDRTRVFCDMMTSVGMQVIAYGGENHDLSCEHVSLVTRDEQREWWPDYEPKRDVFNSFDPSDEGWSVFNFRAIMSLHERAEPGDILCCTMGLSHKPIADAMPNLFAVESGIGYSGVFAPYRIYESWAWRNYITGKYMDDTQRAFDTVLPRAYPISDFPLGSGEGGYYLFLGRVTERKGPHIAALACERIGAKLVVAGQGEEGVWWKGKGPRIDGMLELPGDVEYVGVVDANERAELMGNAIAVFTPSQYLEPLCGVSIEAQLCGTPVIASNWGALVENVSEGSGFLCDTLADYCAAAELAPTLNRSDIRKRAVERWSTDTLGFEYMRYFTRIQTLLGEGWYA